MNKLLLSLFFLILFNICLLFAQNSTEKSLRKLAYNLAHKYPMVDGHVDLPYRLKMINFRLTKDYLGIPIKSKEGNFDYERAKKGGLTAPIMSIFIPADYQHNGGAKLLADSLINMVSGIAQNHPDKFKIASSPQTIEQNFKKGIISLPMGMENGAPIENDLKNIAYFRQKGISYITLTHTEDNQICDSSGDKKRTWGGLSPFGEAVVKEMNRVGIMIDISHVSDETFFQVMETSKAPCIASHSSCRTFTPDFPRNMSDEMIKKLAEKDGVIMISFGNMFLDNKSALHYLTAAKGPSPEVGIQKIVEHIDHIVKLVGINHVGFGSDFDGVSNALPNGMKDVSAYPNLIFELLKKGYSEADIAKICYQNVFRVWNKVLEMAEK